MNERIYAPLEHASISISGDSVRLRGQPWRMLPTVYQIFGRAGAHTNALLKEFAHSMVRDNRTDLYSGPVGMHPEVAESYLQKVWHRRRMWKIRECMHENIRRCWNIVYSNAS